MYDKNGCRLAKNRGGSTYLNTEMIYRDAARRNTFKLIMRTLLLSNREAFWRLITSFKRGCCHDPGVELLEVDWAAGARCWWSGDGVGGVFFGVSVG